MSKLLVAFTVLLSAPLAGWADTSPSTDLKETYCRNNPVYLVENAGKKPTLTSSPTAAAKLIGSAQPGTRVRYHKVLIEVSTGKAIWYQLENEKGAWIKAESVSCKRPVAADEKHAPLTDRDWIEDVSDRSSIFESEPTPSQGKDAEK